MFRKCIYLKIALLLSSALLMAAQREERSDFGAGLKCEEGRDCSGLPVVQSNQGIVYNAGNAIVELNPSTGKPSWSYSPSKGRVSSNILILGNLLIFTGNTDGPCGPAYAVEANTRKIVWSESYSSCRLWTDGRLLYLQGNSGDGIRALDPRTGKEVWYAEDETPTFVQTLVIHSSLIYTNDRILNSGTGQTISWVANHSYLLSVLATRDILFTGTTTGSLDAIDISDASERWHSNPLNGYELSAILASDQMVFAVAYEGDAKNAHDGILQAFQSDNGRLKWSYSLHSCCQDLDYSPIAEKGDKLFLLAPENKKSGTKLIAFNSRTGKQVWSFSSDSTLEGPPAIVGEHLYLTNSKGELIALDPTTGHSIWKYTP